MIEKCPICGGGDLHKDDKIHSESVIVVCKACGFASHDYDETKEAEMLAYYKNQHRKAVIGKQKPDYANIITTNNKKALISKFLADFLKDKKGLIVGDIGAATGYLVHWFRTLGHRATGSEYAVQYRRMSEHYYGVPLTEELPTKHKYDLLTIYHVLEHMIRPDLKLMKYRDMLADGGHIMISVPEYFNRLDEGTGTNVIMHNTSAQHDFDGYFHKDHVNIFSRVSIKNLVAKCGFEIVKDEYEGCGITLLCKKIDLAKYEPIVEDYGGVLKKIQSVKNAILAAKDNNWAKAIEIYPEFPEAHVAMIMMVNQKDPTKQTDYMDQIEKNCPQTCGGARYLSTKGAWLYQNQRYQEALETLEKCVNLRPNPDIFMFISWCLLELNRPHDAIKILNYAMMLNPGKWIEALNFQLNAACSIPTWDERAMEEMKHAFTEQNKSTIEAMSPKDPVMDGV